MDLMRKESIESTKPPLPAFGFQQEAGHRVASPIATLAGVTSQVKQTVDDQYVSRGLAFFKSAAQNGIPQTTSITNSLQQNSREWASSHSGQTLNVSSGSPAAQSMESQGSLIKTPTFSVISQPETVARNNVDRISSDQSH